MSEPSPESALGHAARHLRRLGVGFALVGGLASSIRGEVRFTRDVDLVVTVMDDDACDTLVRELRSVGYEIGMLVEQQSADRIATVRLVSPSGLLVDLITATCGIEAEIVDRAEPISWDRIGTIPVACAEELLAMKVLSMSETRLQDRIDARNILAVNPDIDLERVEANLRLITDRGYARDQDLMAKLAELVIERPTS